MWVILVHNLLLGRQGVLNMALPKGNGGSTRKCVGQGGWYL